jgi:broad specificity phosphatase PhoE
VKKNKKFDPLDYREPITKIYFVRHGETRANKLKLFFGQLDWNLNKNGVKQAKKVANKLHDLQKALNSKGANISCIISSPLKRTRHTSKIIAGRLKIKKMVFDKDLIEKSEGTWQGRDFWQVRKEEPENYSDWLENPFKNRPPRGESITDLKRRILRFYKKVLKKYLGKHIIVVAHSGSIKMFILHSLGLDVNKFWHIKVECGSISELHLSKKHCMLWSLNQY